MEIQLAKSSRNITAFQNLSFGRMNQREYIDTLSRGRMMSILIGFIISRVYFLGVLRLSKK